MNARKNWRVESSTRHITDRDFTGYLEAVFVCKYQSAEGWPSVVRDLSNGWIVYPPKNPRGES